MFRAAAAISEAESNPASRSRTPRYSRRAASKGTGSPIADSGDGGQATRAELGYSTGPDVPRELEFFGAAADPQSDVYLSDDPDNLIKMIAGRSGNFLSNHRSQDRLSCLRQQSFTPSTTRQFK